MKLVLLVIRANFYGNTLQLVSVSIFGRSLIVLYACFNVDVRGYGVENMPSEGLFWLFEGGVAYTTGAIIYRIRKIPLNHAIFHIFVLLGSFCHFIGVYYYGLLPN